MHGEQTSIASGVNGEKITVTAPPDADVPASEAVPESVPVPRARLSRRQFVVRNLGLLGAFTLGDSLAEPMAVETTRHQVPLRGLHKPMRVVQLTDLHRSWCVSEGFLAKAVAQTNALQPDLVLLTGDFITASTDYMGSCANALKPLRAPLGLFGVLGNHDYRADDWHGERAVTNMLTALDVQILRDCNVLLWNGLRLVGVDDATTQNPDLYAAFYGVQPNEPVLAMTHNPQIWDGMCRYDCVTLAGHTHGGQINIPFFTRGLLTDRSRYLRGWFQKKDAPGRLYVSRGLGVVNVPMRFRARPEIAVFDFVPT